MWQSTVNSFNGSAALFIRYNMALAARQEIYKYRNNSVITYALLGATMCAEPWHKSVSIDFTLVDQSTVIEIPEFPRSPPLQINICWRCVLDPPGAKSRTLRQAWPHAHSSHLSKRRTHSQQSAPPTPGTPVLTFIAANIISMHITWNSHSCRARAVFFL